MANDLNRCEFIGRLGKDPATRYMPNGNAVTEFSLAVGSSWKDKQSGQKQEAVEWVNVVAFKKLAEIMAEYLSKGSQVYISGRLKTEKFEKDGVTKYYTKVIADQLQMLDSRSDSQKPKEAAPGYPDEFVDDNLEDLPF